MRVICSTEGYTVHGDDGGENEFQVIGTQQSELSSSQPTTKMNFVWQSSGKVCLPRMQILSMIVQRESNQRK